MTWRELQQAVYDEEVRTGVPLDDYEITFPDRVTVADEVRATAEDGQPRLVLS